MHADPEPAERPQLVILISGRGSNLRSIVAATRDGSLAADVAGVVANRSDAAGLGWADRQGLPVATVEHRSFETRAAFDQALAGAIEALAPSPQRRWVVLAGFMRILGDAFVERFAGRLVNIHPSLLPAYPGLHTHRQVLADGALLHGATVHLVTPALDHGPIVAQAVVPVLAGDDEATLADRVLGLEHQLYPLALGWLVAGRVAVSDGRARLDGADASAARTLLHPLLQAAPA
ncbi:MAG: phosphoribosylglycinamide formyltransferase [Lautropia sp.]